MDHVERAVAVAGSAAEHDLVVGIQAENLALFGRVMEDAGQVVVFEDADMRHANRLPQPLVALTGHPHPPVSCRVSPGASYRNRLLTAHLNSRPMDTGSAGYRASGRPDLLDER
jgi:hypothetical protein